MKFLWNLRLWFIGIGMVICFPFVLSWMLLVDMPIKLAKEYLASRN